MYRINRKWLVFLGVCLLTACARGAAEPSPSLTPPPPSATAPLPGQTPTGAAPVTGLPPATPASPAYPAPGGAATAGPAAPTLASPTPVSPAPGSPPPYPGPDQPLAATPTTLPPPSPGAGASPASTTTTLPPPYPGGGTSPAPSATAAPTGVPDIPATSTPTEPPASTLPPAETATPTRTPRVQPTVTAAVFEPVCEPEAGLTHCRDPFLDIDFGYPSLWGEILQGDLHPEAGAVYTYEIRGSLRAEGRSGAFVPPLGSGITAFPGFISDLLPERCQQFSPAQICQEIQPQVVLALVFPRAREICDPAPGDLSSPLAILALDLPEHPSINGFVFYRGFLSAFQEARFADYQAELLRPPTGRGCTNFLRSQFNVRVLEMVAGVRNDRLDEVTAANVRRWVTLGESILIGE